MCCKNAQDNKFNRIHFGVAKTLCVPEAREFRYFFDEMECARKKRLALKMVSKLDFVSKKCIRMINFDTFDNRNGVFAAFLLAQGAMIFKIQAVYTRALKAIKSNKKILFYQEEKRFVALHHVQLYALCLSDN